MTLRLEGKSGVKGIERGLVRKGNVYLFQNRSAGKSLGKKEATGSLGNKSLWQFKLAFSFCQKLSLF